MTKHAFIAILAIPAFLAGSMAAHAAPAAAPTAAIADIRLADVKQALAATSSMTADFTQTAGTGAVATGRMLMKRPGRIRFDYGEKTPYLIVSDGKTLSFVDYQVSQVSQWPVKSTPLGVLLNPDADLASVAQLVPADQSPMPGVVAVRAEDRKRPEIGSILFFLSPDAAAPGKLKLIGWRVTDAQGNLTTISLSNIRYGTQLNDSRFRFDDPRRSTRTPGRVG